MLFIKCPYCQEKREEEEFTYSDEAFLVRPLQPEALSDEEWGEYLFARKNTKGSSYERWTHTAGCRKFFIMKRNTVDYKIAKTMTIEEATLEYKQIMEQDSEQNNKHNDEESSE